MVETIAENVQNEDQALFLIKRNREINLTCEKSVKKLMEKLKIRDEELNLTNEKLSEITNDFVFNYNIIKLKDEQIILFSKKLQELIYNKNGSDHLINQYKTNLNNVFQMFEHEKEKNRNLNQKCTSLENQDKSKTVNYKIIKNLFKDAIHNVIQSHENLFHININKIDNLNCDKIEDKLIKMTETVSKLKIEREFFKQELLFVKENRSEISIENLNILQQLNELKILNDENKENEIHYLERIKNFENSDIEKNLKISNLEKMRKKSEKNIEKYNKKQNNYKLSLNRYKQLESKSNDLINAHSILSEKYKFEKKRVNLISEHHAGKLTFYENRDSSSNGKISTMEDKIIHLENEKLKYSCELNLLSNQNTILLKEKNNIYNKMNNLIKHNQKILQNNEKLKFENDKNQNIILNLTNSLEACKNINIQSQYPDNSNFVLNLQCENQKLLQAVNNMRSEIQNIQNKKNSEMKMESDSNIYEDSMKNNVKILNARIIMLENLTIEKDTLIRKLQIKYDSLENKMLKLESEPCKTGFELDHLSYKLQKQEKRKNDDIARLVKKLEDTEVDLKQTRQECDEYYRVYLQQQSEILSLRNEVSSKTMLSAKYNNQGFTEKGMKIKQLELHNKILKDKLLLKSKFQNTTMPNINLTNTNDMTNKHKSFKKKIKFKESGNDTEKSMISIPEFSSGIFDPLN
ncbi:hypothetical protein A3Q56_01292 [Intoshia linei]|uniref:Uncharacterized protein n=1 Tax=Intoshia linei TaxID=1819745 RepID=A0A177B9F7_9BILA|nr:hypothetical protein A3Q56_01292 [Intoshia linei]